MNTKPIFLTLCLVCTLGAPVQSRAQDESSKESKPTEKGPYLVRGKVVIPDDVSEAINTEGLSVAQAVVTLKGKYKHPRLPYPANYREMEVEERIAWREAYMKTDAYKVHLVKVEEARSKRKVYTTEINEDGSFTFPDVEPAWYQLTATIMHPSAGDEQNPELARGWAMHQLFVKTNKKVNYFYMPLKLKNVLTAGDQAPEWTATAYDGSEFKLSDFRGKYVLFDFWATWCGPCRAEFPNLAAVFKDFGGERFEMVGLSVDESIDTAKTVLEESSLPYRQGWVGDLKRHEEIAEAYGFESIPSIWLIGPDGKIIARDLYGEEIREAVVAALKDQAKSK
ncbi:MAG: redoxin domain-containing protein [Fuerstiella sp.]